MKKEKSIKQGPDMDYYMSHLVELLRKYPDKYVLIHNGELAIVADSREELDKKASEENISGGLRTKLSTKRRQKGKQLS